MNSQFNRKGRWVTRLLMGAILCIGPPSWASTSLIGFDGVTTTGQFLGTLNEDGFVYGTLAGGLFAEAAYGNPAPEMQALAAFGGGVLKVASETVGGQFLFAGLDVAQNGTGSTSQAVTIQGYLGGSLLGTETFYALAPVGFYGVFSTASATAGGLQGLAIDELRISLPGLSVSDAFWYTRIDNVDLAYVPEPVAFALVSIGLVGIGFSRRRKRK